MPSDYLVKMLKKSFNGILSSRSKKCDFCFAPFFEHLHVRKMCATSAYRPISLLKIVFQQPDNLFPEQCTNRRDSKDPVFANQQRAGDALVDACRSSP